MWGLGGVCDKEGRFQELSYYDGGWGTHGGAFEWTAEEEEYVNSDAVYFGLFAQHWGHFLIDMITRAWALPILLGESWEFKVAYLGDETPSGNCLRFFELLGVRKEQLYHITKPTRFRKVFLPQQGFKSCEWYSQEHLDMLDLVVENALAETQNEGNEQLPKKVYFSRTHFPKAAVSEFGEGYFEELFVKNGYVSIAPETETLEKQILLWNTAEDIACINGSIPLNLMFCRNDQLRLIILNKTSIRHENPYVLLEMRNVQADFVDIYKEPVKGYPKSLGEGPYLLWPTEDFDDFCREKNWAQPMGQDARKRFFNREKRRYYRAVIGLRQKVRTFLSRHLSGRTKTRIKRILGK